jgi:hypothetical protein
VTVTREKGDKLAAVDPLVKAAAFAAVALSLGLLAVPGRKTEVRVGAPTGAAAKSANLASVCGPGTLPDGDQCVPVPVALSSVENDRSRVRALDHLPRRPDRPADFARYRYPLTPRRVEPEDTSSGDSSVTALLLRAQPGSEVRSIALAGQEGDARVVSVGTLRGNSVVTHHRVREASGTRDYLLVVGGLESTTGGLAPGSPLPQNVVLGALPARSEQGEPSLFLAVRRLRAGYDMKALEGEDVLTSSRTISSDPRNVLPLQAQ